MKAKYCYLCGKPLPKGRIKQCADCYSQAKERRRFKQENKDNPAPKICEWCGKEYKPNKITAWKQRFCRDECERAWQKENRDWSKTKKYIYNCKNCGREYTAKAKNRDTFCSKKCTGKWKLKQAQVEKICSSCGETFITTKAKPDYCSKKCYLKSLERVCDECGKRFIPTTAAQKLCSRKCQLKKGRDKFRAYKENIGRNWGRIETLICKHCGNKFIRPVYNQTPSYCSKKCARRAWVKANPELTASMKAKQSRKRRAMKYNNGPVENIDPLKVYERDGWRCGVCGKKVTPHLKFPHLKSASLDHIVALSKGGTHTWSNVQLVHFICNSIKSDIGGGQLRLEVVK